MVGRGDRRRAARRGGATGFVLARNHGTLLPLTGRSLRKVAVIGPNAAVARTLGGGTRDGLPALHGLAARRAARGAPTPRSRTRRGVKAHTRLPVAEVSSADVRFLAADGTSRRRAARDRRVHLVRTTRRTAIEVHTTITADGRRRAPDRCVRRRALHAHARTARSCSTRSSRWARTRTRASSCSRRRSAASRSRSPPGEAVEVRAAARGTTDLSFQLNHDPPFRRTAELEDAAVELARDADLVVVVVGTTPEVESEGFDRTTLGLAGRAGRARPARQRTPTRRRRRRQRRRAGADAVDRARRPPCC